jgi:hypothetical protein
MSSWKMRNSGNDPQPITKSCSRSGILFEI